MPVVGVAVSLIVYLAVCKVATREKERAGNLLYYTVAYYAPTY